jgi:DNA-binding IclR family transcriptional regulator
VLGSAFLGGLDLRQEAKPVLAEIGDATGETCHLAIRDGRQIVYIEKLESTQPVRMHSWIGATNPMYCTGVGKAILAFSDESVQSQVLADDLVKRTANTITEPEALREELATIRQRGFSIDNEENERSIRCAAAPVFDHTGQVVAGLSVSGPTYRLPDERLQEVGKVVMEVGLRLSTSLGHNTILQPSPAS